MVHSGIPWSGDLPSRFKDNSDRNFERALLLKTTTLHNQNQTLPGSLLALRHQ